MAPGDGADRTVERPLELAEGATDPLTNKVIGTLIIVDNGFCVYLDPACAVHCSPVVETAEYPHEAGEVFNRVTYLETLAIPLEGTKSRRPMGMLLGQAVARMISEDSAGAARSMLDKAQGYLDARRAELARIWYLAAAGAVAALLTGVALSLWVWRCRIEEVLGKDAFFVLLTGCCGGIGAFMSLLARSNTLGLEPGAGRPIHLVEGVARVVAGLTGGFTVALAVKAQLALGVVANLQGGQGLAATLLLGLASGASERLVPELVGKIHAGVGPQPAPGAGASPAAAGAAAPPADGSPPSGSPPGAAADPLAAADKVAANGEGQTG